MKHLLALAAMVSLSCDPGRTSFRDLYSDAVHLTDEQARGLFEACPGDQFGPHTLRWLENPQPDTTVVRYEFSKSLTGDAGFDYAACIHGYLKEHGLAEIETGTSGESEGTGSTT